MAVCSGCLVFGLYVMCVVGSKCSVWLVCGVYVVWWWVGSVGEECIVAVR